MTLYRRKKRGIVAFALPIVLFLAAFLWLYFGILDTGERSSEEGRQMTQQAIERAVVQCYAVEGAYPQSLAYLEEHYGLTVDHSRYVVTYDVFAANVRPYVEVQQKGQG